MNEEVKHALVLLYYFTNIFLHNISSFGVGVDNVHDPVNVPTDTNANSHATVNGFEDPQVHVPIHLQIRENLPNNLQQKLTFLNHIRFRLIVCDLPEMVSDVNDFGEGFKEHFPLSFGRLNNRIIDVVMLFTFDELVTFRHCEVEHVYGDFA